jgi:hypothetical protein
VITQKLLEFAVFLLELVVGAVPIPQPPEWLAAPSGAVATVFQGAASLGVWFPTGLVLTVLAGVLAIRVSGLGIKIGRMVLSLVTGGGGNAGG